MNNGKRLYQGGIWSKDSFRLEGFTEQDAEIYRVMVDYDFYNRVEKMGFEGAVTWYYEPSEGFLMVDADKIDDGEWLAEMMMEVRSDQLGQFKYLKAIGRVGRYIEICLALARMTQDDVVHRNWDEHLVDNGWDDWVVAGNKHEIDLDPASFLTQDGGLNIEWAEGLEEEEVLAKGPSRYLQAVTDKQMMIAQLDIDEYLKQMDYKKFKVDK